MTTRDQAPRPYLRTPVISPDGTRIAFVYAMDIWLVDSRGGDAERLSAHPANHHAPVWSPDGHTLAFCSNRVGSGEIYLLPLDGGSVQRVTSHGRMSTPLAWSADDQIYFTSYREQQSSALYRVHRDGGTPIMWLAQPYEQLDHMAISPDGSRMAFNVVRASWWRREPGPYSGSELWVTSHALDAADFRRMAASYAGLNRWPMWAVDGAGLFYISDRDGVENIWFEPMEGGEARAITSFRDGRVLWPTISANGAAIVFEREFGIWRLDLASGVVAALPVRVRPDTKQSLSRPVTYTRDLIELALAPDGKKVAFVARGEIFVDFADKEAERERRLGPSFRVTNTPFRESDIDWAPDSRNLVYTSDRHGDQELYRYDFATRIETRLTNAPLRKCMPTYAPNGAWIAYARGSDEIRLIDTASGEDQAFVRANLAIGTSFAWSPDSRWLVFSAQDDRAFSNMYVQRMGETSARQISFLSNLSAFRPLWSSDGLFLVFTTQQYRDEAQIVRIDLQSRKPQFREDEFEKLFEAKDSKKLEQKDDSPEASAPLATADVGGAPVAGEEPAPGAPAAPPASSPAPAPQKPEPKQVEIVFAGIERRRQFLTAPQLDASAQAISPDARDLVFLANFAGKTNLWTMPLDEARAEQAPRQLTASTSGKWTVQFAPDGKSFYYLDAGQITIRKFPGGEATQLQVSADVLIDFHQEKLQVFDESWRTLRDNFYDPAFRGLDWNAVHTRFRPLAEGAQTSADLHAIMNLMIGELRASHTGASGRSSTPDDGYIGVVWDSAAQAADGRLQAVQVIPDGPAALAGIVVGEVLVAVDSVALEGTVSLDALFHRTVGRRVRLRMLALDGSTRELAIRPISAYEYDALRYNAWVDANEVYVHGVSGGRLGYVHIRDMSYPAYQRFLSDLDSEAHSKAGVVVDIRFNGGGHISTFILDVLARRSVLLKSFRSHAPVDAAHYSGNRVLNKPTVLVINESSGSNAEMFAEGYRRLRLGSIVGRPTAGAVIGTTSATLLDGTTLRVPSYRVFTLEGEDLEGKGRAVDIDVPLPLGATARGRDTQLDVAVATLLQQIDEGRPATDDYSRVQDSGFRV